MTPNQSLNLIVPIPKGQGMVKLRTDDPGIVAIPDMWDVFLSPLLFGLVPMLPILSVPLGKALSSFLHFLPHDVSETSAPQMLITCKPEAAKQDTEDHDEDEHCPDGSLVYFYEMETAAFRVGNEVL